MLKKSSYLSALKSQGVLVTHTMCPALASEAFCSMYSGTPGDHLGDPSSTKPTLFPRPSGRAEGLSVALA